MRLLSGCRALIGTDGGVALNQLHAIERDAQLLGNELRLRRVETLTDLALARERRDAAIGIDRDPPIELIAAGGTERLQRSE